jgi:hypothetical protein
MSGRGDGQSIPPGDPDGHLVSAAFPLTVGAGGWLVGGLEFPPHFAIYKQRGEGTGQSHHTVTVSHISAPQRVFFHQVVDAWSGESVDYEPHLKGKFHGFLGLGYNEILQDVSIFFYDLFLTWRQYN